jgi:inorganic pyrophosphatase
MWAIIQPQDIIMPIQNLSTNFLGKIVTVKMDRPLGTKHPKHGFVYPVNYGFIPNTVSGDGEELDAYVLGPTVPLDTFTGYVCAIIHRTDDDDDKLVVVPNGENPTDAEIEEKTKFQEQWFKHVIIRPE